MRCDERYPRDGAHSVVCVVVEREAAQFQPRLAELHTEYFGDGDPLAPVQLEIVDRATDDAIRRLIAAGLIAPTPRGNRLLFSATPEAAPPPLTPHQQAEIAALQAQSARKLKLARTLGDAGFVEETRTPLLSAILLRARAIAIEHSLPEPADLGAAMSPPLSTHWQTARSALQDFVASPESNWQPAAAALEGIP